MVDEYQDTNRAQYRFIQLLSHKHLNLCVVGDDDQSIYAWRGADVSNILSFERDFPQAKVIRLEQNYRSTKTILQGAHGIISHNRGRKPKQLWTENEAGQTITLFAAPSEREEAKEISRRIVAHKQAGSSYNDIAIFYRTNAQSRPFEDVFREYAIPYRIYGGIRFYQRQEIKDILSYLRLIASAHDDLAFKRIINVPARGIGKVTIEKLEEIVKARQCSLFDALPRGVQAGLFRGAAAKQLETFYLLLSGFQQRALTLPLLDLVKAVLEQTGYIQMLTDQSTLEAEGRLENINEFIAAVEEFCSRSEENQLQRFLDEVALVSAIDETDESTGAVTLMTLHLAKGLEFPHVFMVGMEEGLFPHGRSLDDPDALEEERRLCYVGMTRAMKTLVMSYARRRQLFGALRYGIASRFLKEIPEGCVQQETKASPVVSKERNSSFDHDFDQRPSEEESGFAPGQRVTHPTFGVGTIKQCEPSSIGHRVTVHFQNGEVKRLIAEYAGLHLL